MTGYIFKRLLEMIPTLFGITLISFAILHLAPGKPTDVLTELNPKITGKGLEKIFSCYPVWNLAEEDRKA
jgi:peptide/nickel transport system permease protein